MAQDNITAAQLAAMPAAQRVIVAVDRLGRRLGIHETLLEFTWEAEDIPTISTIPAGRSEEDHTSIKRSFASFLDRLKTWKRDLQAHYTMLDSAVNHGTPLSNSPLSHESWCGWYGQRQWADRPTNPDELRAHRDDCWKEKECAEHYIDAMVFFMIGPLE